MSAPSALVFVTPELIERFKAYHEEHGAWGSLHVVLDDGNFKDVFVHGCVDYAKARNDQEGLDLGNILLSLSQTQRSKISKRA